MLLASCQEEFGLWSWAQGDAINGAARSAPGISPIPSCSPKCPSAGALKPPNPPDAIPGCPQAPQPDAHSPGHRCSTRGRLSTTHPPQSPWLLARVPAVGLTRTACGTQPAAPGGSLLPCALPRLVSLLRVRDHGSALWGAAGPRHSAHRAPDPLPLCSSQASSSSLTSSCCSSRGCPSS